MELGEKTGNAMEGHYLWHKGSFCGFRLHLWCSKCEGTSAAWQGGKELSELHKIGL